MTTDLATLTADDVRSMSYNELIGLVRETNRIPGGSATVHGIATRCHIRPDHRVLDIGTSTGETAIELGVLTGCHVLGVDLNEVSLAEARRRAAVMGLDKVEFRRGDATALDLDDESMDVVICGNVTALVDDRAKALAEYVRVLRGNGHLIAVPMYYVDEPSDDIVERVRTAIQVPIEVQHRAEATDFYLSPELMVLDLLDYRFDRVGDAAVDAFCDDILGRPHLDELAADARVALDAVYRDMMFLFRDNLAMMGFTIMVFRKPRERTDPELFTARPTPPLSTTRMAEA